MKSHGSSEKASSAAVLGGARVAERLRFRRRLLVLLALIALLIVVAVGALLWRAADRDRHASEEVAAATVLAAIDWDTRLPAFATRVTFRSFGAHLQPTVVSGVVLRPYERGGGAGAGTGAGTPGTPRGLVVIAPGTLGMADRCASSIAIKYEAPPTPPTEELLAAGYAVAIVDYEGLSTPGVHPYLNRLSAGHSMLDMTRVAQQIFSTEYGEALPTVLFGYSQGAGASLAAAELVETYAPELKPTLAGVYAGAVPADLVATAGHITDSALSGLIGYVIESVAVSYPETQLELEANLTDAGWDFVAGTAEECIGDTVARWPHLGEEQRRFVTGDRRFADLLSDGSAPTLLQVLEQQKLGQSTPAMPLFITHNAADDVLPVAPTRELVAAYQAQGADVIYREVDVSLGDASHGLAYTQTWDEAFAWVKDRLEG